MFVLRSADIPGQSGGGVREATNPSRSLVRLSQHTIVSLGLSLNRFQSVVVRSLVGTMERIAEEYRPRTLIVAGGVACNGALRDACSNAAERLGIPVYFPSPHLSTDNAAMIAAAGTVKLQAGERAGLDLNADVTLRLQNIDVEDEELRRAGVHYRL